MINVLLVTTWGTACGIAEHSAMLKEAVERADPEIQITPFSHLAPQDLPRVERDFQICHLNYQAALLSRWTPEHIRSMCDSGVPVVVTFHDTGVPNSDQCKAIIDAADAAVVHEPFDDLPVDKTHYWRMGVPGWEDPHTWHRSKDSWTEGRPILGSVGFPFPWKNYDTLAELTARVGWALYLCAPTATFADRDRWCSLNPHLWVDNGFESRSSVISRLGGCDATAFCYTCANTGQSGAILQGLAARKPVIALSSCRQMRALYQEYPWLIRWAKDFNDVADHLKTLPIERVDSRSVYVAEQESWSKVGAKYAALYRGLL